MRLEPIKERGNPLTLHLNGESVTAYAGETVAAVLLAAGQRTFRRTRHRAAPRSLFCGIGICYDCLVTIDDTPNIRACITVVQPGMRIDTTPTAPPEEAAP